MNEEPENTESTDPVRAAALIRYHLQNRGIGAADRAELAAFASTLDGSANSRIPVHHGDTLVGYATFRSDGHLELHPPEEVVNRVNWPTALAEPGHGVLAELDRTDVLGRLLVACVDKPEEVRAALTLRPCHITGMHDPDHHAKYTCSEQLTAVLQLLLAAMGVTHEDLPRGLHPGDEYWCHSVPVQEKYRERLRGTYAWAGVEIPARLAAPGSD